MYFKGTKYSGVDFARLNEVSNPLLESMYITIKYEIAELKANKGLVLLFAIKSNQLNIQLNLIEQEIAERILLDQWGR